MFVYLAVYLLGLLTFVLLWWIASSTGTTGNIESFLRDVGFKNFHFNGPELFLGAALIGIVLALTATLLSTVVAAMVNLVSELTGGIQLVVIESPFANDVEPEAAPERVAESPMPIARTEPARPRERTEALRPAPLATVAPVASGPGMGGEDGGATVRADGRADGAGDGAASGNGVASATGRWTNRALALLRGDGSSVRTDQE